ncbi:hypothetical protein W97_01202 [Coniosporium apollinis CBS 100218]|uniref:Uncharacterized protein n=1 Tax=Coniosporium apollinis (strain CBS 100218) TaxID=1168221 RepID=R7YJJ6_CONA1|nr:uncharacterized protein W97_01202 [Coniosporium apollinis CBS 100218]EON61984.1 hypothetical protein W97_01202 [Coniosporium apollinis CBS 100218]
MPALTFPSSYQTAPATSSPAAASSASYSSPEQFDAGSRSPPRPPVSPITPVASHAQLAPIEDVEDVLPPPATKFVPPPPPVPISESENPDAIALRSSISLLQLQREKSKKDIKTLEQIKQAALADPEAFLKELTEGRLRGKHAVGDILGPTLADLISNVADQPYSELGRNEAQDSQDPAPEDSTAPLPLPAEPPSRFPSIPQPQNIFRTPPINWAKYHVVGESLDKLHEEQRQRPAPGQPSRDDPVGRAPVHVIAAPYSPFTDKPHPMQTRKDSKRMG